MKQFTLKEVAEHNSEKSCWFVIYDQVYDVTSFLHEHPSGQDPLIEVAGKEATEEFEDAKHSEDAREMMKKFKIGELVESDRRKNPLNVTTIEKKSENNEYTKLLLALPILLGIFVILVRFYLKE